MSKTLSRDIIHRMPKTLLHDHLDGGLRPETILELAADRNIELQADEPDALRQWFFRGANRGSLPEYLEGFGITCGLMQDEEALERVAYELIEDMESENVVYTEIRFAPIFHTDGGLNLEQVMTAVLNGLDRGRAEFDVQYSLILCGMRNMDPAVSLQMAELAIAFRERGCRGFDLAGDESGHPPKNHLDAFHLCQRENFNITIHAGEAFGKVSIWQALQYCGAHRIGHGTRLLDDMTIHDGEIVALGPLASFIRDHRIPIEVCLQSNVHTGAIADLADHPFRHLYDAHFRVTINTDNRLMSNTTMTEELEVAHKVFGLDAKDIEKIMINGMKSAFIDYDERCRIIYDRIKAGYRDMREEGLI